jgi:cyclopropane-fatty-acyl-phospholipid synthase
MSTTLATEQPARDDSSALRLCRLIEPADIPCEIVLPSGQRLSFGHLTPRFHVTFHSDRALRAGLDEFALAEAYIHGEIDIDGDMMSLLDLRSRLTDRPKLPQVVRFLYQLFLSRPTRVNRSAIGAHYNYGDDLFLCFMDSKYHMYSHGIFRTEDDSLEQASERKCEQMWNALQLRPGMRLLDIGAGWGAATSYCGPRGVDVTSLTIAEDSRRFIANLLKERRLPGEVMLQDFLEHRPAEPYDAIVIFGVIEHLPNYRRFCTQVWECLKPGGLIYLDGSASKQKYHMGSFARRYIWQGTHTFCCLQDLIGELLYHGLDLLEVRSETRDYELTMRHWAERFDANREMIIRRWGDTHYRAWHLYLWGGSHGFRNDILQAYHVVARRRADRGPRPGLIQRCRNFVLGLA